MLKRIIALVILLLITGAAAVVWVALRAGEQGEGEVERWLGEQIVSIVDSNLNPKLSFDSIDYQYPSTVHVKNLKLTADDPRASAATLDVISAGEGVITLGEIPEVGRPIVIERISLSRPTVRLVRGDASTGMVGFTNMVKRSDAATRPASTQTVQAKLREVLKIRRIELIDGRIEYDPRIDDTQPMVLDQITALLEVQPDAGGNYRVQMNLGREPLVQSSLRGDFDLDAMRLRNLHVTLSTDLAPDKLQFLPPQLQGFIKKHDARGELTIDATGDLPLADPSAGRFAASIKLASANFRMDKFSFPISSLDCELRVADQYLEIDKLSLAALKGEISVSGGVRLSERRETGLELRFNDLLLHELLAEQVQDDSSLCGRLSGKLRIDAPLGVLAAKLRAVPDSSRVGSLAAEPWPAHWGSGEMELKEACLVRVPLLNNINSAIADAASLVTHRGPPGRQEKLRVIFELIENRVVFSEIQYIGDMIAGGGTGHLTLDRQLDLTLSGGPVERVAKYLGPGLGGLVGKVSDAVASYHVQGTTDKPQVTVLLAPSVFGGMERLGDMLRGPK